MKLKPNAPRVFEPLLKPSRYKGAHGGRGSGKSHLFAELLISRHVHQPGMHSVCIREVQKSLAQSAKRTLELKIQALGVGHLFDVQKAEIKTPGGGLIIFQGMQNHTAESIKSLEGYDVAWVEEAQTLSKFSMRMLRPTIRKPGSELWFSWNPKKPDDPVDALLRSTERPPNSLVVQANWQDNPWFHETTLVEEKDYDLNRDPDTYAHVWLGDYERNSEARVFRNWKVEWFETPADAVFYLGADWGFAQDPTVAVRCFIKGRTLFVDREVWKIGCPIDRTAALFDQIDPTWSPQNAVDPKWRSMARNLLCTADSARPETIEYVQRAGYPKMRAAIKGPGSVAEGVEFLKAYDIIVHPDCRHVADELARYSYKIDPHTEEVTSILEDKKNHTIDSLRYALEAVRRAPRPALTGVYQGH